MFLKRLDRYILKIAAVAAIVLLVGLTSVIWVTQALREVDLLTGKGQTILIFFTVTLLSLPALIAGIAPVALFMATLYTLNKLNGDSELIVMNAAASQVTTQSNYIVRVSQTLPQVTAPRVPFQLSVRTT